MKKIFLIGLLVIALFVVNPKISSAQQYGGTTQSYSIIVDKMVNKPGTDTYVDNLSVSDPRFAPGSIVMFRIRIKNTSTIKLVGMEVKDTLPSYVEPVEGPGTYNSSTREITFNAGDFEVDQEKTFYIKTKVVSQASLPSDRGLICVTNFVKATSSNAYDDDTAQLCIEKTVNGVTSVPKSGPELGIILLAGNVLGVSAGLYLKKRS